MESYRLMQLTQGEIPKGGDCIWSGNGILIPPLPASGLLGCNIINIHYCLKVSYTHIKISALNESH